MEKCTYCAKEVPIGFETCLYCGNKKIYKNQLYVRPNFFAFKGRINRARYIWSILSISVIAGLAGVFWPSYAIIIIILAQVALFFPTAKRFHDVDFGGGGIVLMLIPVLGLILGFVILFIKGTIGPNEYGPDPLSKGNETKQDLGLHQDEIESYNTPANNSDNILDKLAKLSQLKESGVITPEEFQKLKANLLGGGSADVEVATNAIPSTQGTIQAPETSGMAIAVLKSRRKKSQNWYILGAITAGLIFFCLFFRVVTSRIDRNSNSVILNRDFTVITKKHPTFSDTFVYLDDFIKRYNNAIEKYNSERFDPAKRNSLEAYLRSNGIDPELHEELSEKGLITSR